MIDVCKALLAKKEKEEEDPYTLSEAVWAQASKQLQ